MLRTLQVVAGGAGADGAKQLAKAGGVRAIMLSAHAHSSVLTVQRAAMRALAAIATAPLQGDDRVMVMGLILREKAVRALLAAMRTHYTDALMSAAACLALGAITKHDVASVSNQLDDDWESVLERAVVTHGVSHAIADNVGASIRLLKEM